MVEDLIQRTIDPVNDALKQAGLSPRDIDEVVLVGGQTRMPRVIEAVQKVFGKEPNRNINPDEVVAVGAAVQAGILRGDIKDMILLDVTPLSLGLETHGGVFTKVIERNSTIPTKNSLIFTTVVDHQNKVTVHVLQGEREFARDNKSLGKFDLVGIPAAPRGVPQIEVTFSIDSNGIVSVTARDQATGQSTGVQINPAGGLSQDEIDRLVNEAAEHSRTDATRREIRMLQNKLEGMIYTNDKVFREFGKMLSDEDRDKVQKCISKAKESVASEDKQQLNDAIFDLQTASRILTSVMLYNPMKMNVPGDTHQPVNDGYDRKTRLLRGPRSGPHGRRRRHQEGIPPPGGEVPPRQESGRCRRRGEVQGGGRSVWRASRTTRSVRATTASAIRPSADGGFDPNQFADFGDILGDLFGFGDFFGTGRKRSARAARGNDVRYDLTLEFEEAVFGKDITIDVPRVATCEVCHGSGAKAGTQPVTCTGCAAADRCATPRASSPWRGRVRNAAARGR